MVLFSREAAGQVSGEVQRRYSVSGLSLHLCLDRFGNHPRCRPGLQGSVEPRDAFHPAMLVNGLHDPVRGFLFLHGADELFIAGGVDVPALVDFGGEKRGGPLGVMSAMP